MAAHRDSGFPSHGENHTSAVISSAENAFYKYVRELDYSENAGKSSLKTFSRVLRRLL